MTSAKKGVYIISITSPESGMNLINQVYFDAVICDYDLPEMNGLEFLKSARRMGYEGAFIFLTGNSDQEIAAKALHLGADDYYQKETSMPQFESLVRGLETAIKSRHSDKERIKSQEKWFNIFEKASVVIYELDRNGIIISANKALGDFLGLSQDQVIGRSLIDFVEQSYKKNFEKMALGEWDEQDGEILNLNCSSEVLFNCKGGKKKFGYVQVVFLFPEGRRCSKRHFQGCIGIINDIDRIQSFLQESSYNKVFEISHDGFLLISDSYKIAQCNEKASEILGYTKKDLLGKTLEEISSINRHISRESLKVWEKYLAAAFNGMPQSFHWKYTSKSGSLADLEVALQRIVLSDRSFLHAAIRDVTERYLVMKDIESSEQRYRQFADNMKIGVCFIKNGQIVFINQRLAELLGYGDPDELIGGKFSALVRLTDRRRIQEIITAHENKKLKPVEEKAEVISKKGAFLTVRLLIENSHFLGSSVCTVAFVKDRKPLKGEVLKASANSDERQIIDGIALPLMELDLNGKIIMFNAISEEYFKFNITSLRNKSLFSVVAAKYSQDARKAFSLAVSGITTSAVLGFRQYPGEEYFRFIPKIDDNKKVTGVLLETVRSSDTGSDDEVLFSSGSNYHALLESAHEGIAMVDQNEVILYTNPAFAGMLKYKTGELVGKSLKIILYPDQWDAVRQETVKRKKNMSSRYSLMLLTKDGETRKAQLSVSPLKDRLGRFKGGVAVISDITEQEKTADDLRLTNRRMSVLLQVINTTHQKLPLRKMLIKTLSSAVKFADTDSGVIFVFGDDADSSLLVSHNLADKTVLDLQKVDFHQKPFNEMKNGKSISGLSSYPGMIFVPFLSDGNLLGCIGLMFSHRNTIGLEDEDALKYLAGEIADGIKQNKYEEQLKDAAQKYERLFDQTSVGVLLFDTDFNILQSNNAVAKLTGYKKSELEKMNAEQLIGKKLHEIHKKMEQYKGRPFIYQHKLIKANGEILEVSNRSISLLDRKGRLIGYQTVLQDRTTEISKERKLNYLNNLRNGLNIISEELHIDRPLKEKLDYITRESVSKLDVDNILIWLKDDVNTFDFLQDSLVLNLKTNRGKKPILNSLKLASYSPPSIVASINLRRGHYESSGGSLFTEKYGKVSLKQTAADSKIYPFDRSILKNLQISWIGFFPIRGLNGEKIGVVSMLKKNDIDRDVHDLYKTVAELIGRIVVENLTREASKESLGKYRYLYESALSGIYQTTIEDGTFISANETTAAILGYKSVKDLINKCKFSDLYPQSERQKFVEILKRDGVINDCEIRAILMDGREVYLLINARIFEKQGYIEGAITDITRLKKLEEELRRKNTEMEEFISSVSHDLKSPLFSISGYTEMLSEMGMDAGKRTEIIGNIQRNLMEMSGFISGLLDLSRAGKVIGEISELPIRAIINSIFKEAEINEKNAVFTSEGIPKTIKAGYRIKEVFQNLITNAVQARIEGKILNVSVKCRSVARYWEFTVKDDGKGIKKEDLERIFIPGFTTSTGRKKGSGFGLSIAKRIVQAHNGGIIAKSKPGEGAEFTIMLPKHPSN